MKIDRQKRLLQRTQEYLVMLLDHSDNLGTPRSETAQKHYDLGRELVADIKAEQRRGELWEESS